MPRLADPSGSRLVMVGVDQYLDTRLWPNLPSVTANIRDLRSILVKKSYWGIPEQNCQVISNPSEPGQVLEAMLHAARLATDTVVVYYAGHGAATLDGLILTLSSTTTDNLQWRGIHFSSVRGILHERRAANAVIILDCCFSGLAHSMSDLGTYLGSQIANTSAFMLTSSARDAASLAPPNEPYTAFTAALLEALRDGDYACGEFMSLGVVARKVTNHLSSLGRPVPRFSQSGLGDELAIVRNAKYAKPQIKPTADYTLGHAFSRAAFSATQSSDGQTVRRHAGSQTSGRHADWIRRSFGLDTEAPVPNEAPHSRRALLATRASQTDVGTLVGRTLDAYLSWRNEDGGWPLTIGSPTSNAWSTAQAIYLLTELDMDEFQNEISAAAQWLVANRNYDHGWGMESGVSDVVGTEMAIYAMAPYVTDESAALLKEAAQWLVARQNPQDSGWAYVPRNTISSVFCTAWGIASLGALGRTLHDPILIKVHGQRGKRFLVNAQSKDRRDPGWGKFDGSPTEGMRTAQALIGLVAAGASRGRVAKQGLLALRKEQEPDGGWGDDDGSNIEGTSWAIAAILQVDEQATLDRVLARGVDYLIANWNSQDRGWPERPGEDVEVWCTHHGLVALSRYLAVLASLRQSPRRVLGSTSASRTLANG